MDRQQYAQFVEALRTAEATALPAFEREEAKFFEGCTARWSRSPNEAKEALAFGPDAPCWHFLPQFN
jgi:folate-dependent tRNA-U54 methylase TrmFO/GidA